MKQKVDLNKLKEEFVGRTGQSRTNGRDFLLELSRSVETGVRSESVEKVKKIDNAVAEKQDGITVHRPTHRSQPTQIKENSVNFQDDEFDRESKMYNDLNKRVNQSKSTLAGDMERFLGKTAHVEQQSNTHVGGLNESVVTVVNEYLNENFSQLISEAINNTVMELFAMERIKTVLMENKDIVKKILIEIIKENKEKLKK